LAVMVVLLLIIILSATTPCHCWTATSMVIHGCTTQTGVLFMGSSNKNVRKNGNHVWWCAAVCAAKESIEDPQPEQAGERNPWTIKMVGSGSQFPVEVYGLLQGLLWTFDNWNTYISRKLELACSLLSFNFVLLGVRLPCSVSLFVKKQLERLKTRFLAKSKGKPSQSCGNLKYYMSLVYHNLHISTEKWTVRHWQICQDWRMTMPQSVQITHTAYTLHSQNRNIYVTYNSVYSVGRNPLTLYVDET
jgi:hypothetical protein